MVNFLSKLSKEKSLPYPKYKGTSGVIFHRVNYRMTWCLEHLVIVVAVVVLFSTLSSRCFRFLLLSFLIFFSSFRDLIFISFGVLSNSHSCADQSVLCRPVARLVSSTCRRRTASPIWSPSCSFSSSIHCLASTSKDFQIHVWHNHRTVSLLNSNLLFRHQVCWIQTIA